VGIGLDGRGKRNSVNTLKASSREIITRSHSQRANAQAGDPIASGRSQSADEPESHCVSAISA
jgi:hypothetical protein